jgi:succinate dehydrogenase / fumarate reductase cytochrome b subunit
VSQFGKVLRSSVGKKVLVALSGLGLVGFLIGHVVGNQNMHVGADAMEHYAENLHVLWGFEFGSFLFYFVELGLLGMFLLHIALVFSLIVDNRRARGSDAYAVRASKRKGAASLASRTMAISGVALLAFLVIHVLQIRGISRAHHAEYEHGVGTLVIDTLQSPINALIYIAGSVLVGWHIFHGIQSAARSFGLQHRTWSPWVEKAGLSLSIAITVGFVILPVGVLSGVITEEGSPLGALLAPADPDAEDASAPAASVPTETSPDTTER